MAATSGPYAELVRLFNDTVAPQGTNVFRLSWGKAPSWSGWWIDRYGSHLLIQHPDHTPPHVPADVVFPGAVYFKQLGEAGERALVHIAGPEIKAPFSVMESGLQYEIDFGAGYSTGLFHDQRENRGILRQNCRGWRVLNSFAYTCAFSVAAAADGALTTSVDLSPRLLDWGRRNFALNALAPDAHRFLAGDAFEWLQRFKKRGETFDAVVLDPPTFSRDRKGRVFRVERDLRKLLEATAAVLAPRGWVLVTVNTKRLPRAAIAETIREVFPEGAAILHGAEAGADFGPEPLLRGFWVQRN